MTGKPDNLRTRPTSRRYVCGRFVSFFLSLELLFRMVRIQDPSVQWPLLQALGGLRCIACLETKARAVGTRSARWVLIGTVGEFHVVPRRIGGAIVAALPVPNSA